MISEREDSKKIELEERQYKPPFSSRAFIFYQKDRNFRFEVICRKSYQYGSECNGQYKE